MVWAGRDPKLAGGVRCCESGEERGGEEGGHAVRGGVEVAVV